MGLDQVELVIAIEDAFGIEFPDEEAAEIRTVGDLYDSIVSKLDNEAARRYLTSIAFYRTRRGLVDGLKVRRRLIRPSIPVAPLFPQASRREDWSRVQIASGLRFPNLLLPQWVHRCSLIVAVAVIALSILLVAFGKLSPWVIGPALFLGMGAGGGLLSLARPFANVLPNGLTVGSLAKDVLMKNHAQISAQAKGWNASEVWDILCRLFETVSGVDRQEIRRDAEIVADLGID
jgi:hypothetical protein